MKLNKLLIFDVDGTITAQRRIISPDMRGLIVQLSLIHNVAFLGGGNYQRLYSQLGGLDNIIAGNYGLDIGLCGISGVSINPFIHSQESLNVLAASFKFIRDTYGYTNVTGESFEVHPSGMITFPLLGTGATQELKDVFDPIKQKRLEILPAIKGLLLDFNVIIGGTNSFDILPKGIDKTYGIGLLKETFDQDSMLYIGDDFSKGCNDYAILEKRIPYIQVTTPNETKSLINFLIGG
jgi:HAD superfamily hydrolase (TIGR01484 family)